MKRFLALCIAVILVLSVSISAFAGPGNFVNSPSNNSGPVLVEGENESEDCEAKLVVTPFKDRDKLPAEIRALIEKAYQIIASGIDLTSLNAKFAAFVAGLGLKGSDLAVSDLFDVTYYNCDTHDYHGYFRIKLNSDALRNFVGLLHYHNGEWEFIENARVLPDGETLEFSVEDFSPFAIVVDKSKGSAISPTTGEENYFVTEAVIISVVALGIVAALGFKKKRA